MNIHHDQAFLPVKGNLTLIYVFSLLIAVLMTVAAAAGLLYRADIYPTEELIQSFVPNDAVNLFIGLPILLGSMWLAWHGNWAGLLCWPGALFFLYYNYNAYVFAMPLNWAFLLHLVLVVLSVYTLAGLMAGIDGNLVRQRLIGAVPEKLAGGVLAGLGLLFLLRVIVILVNAIAAGMPLAKPELAVNVSDFLISPAWVIGGILLWRRKAVGYVTGLGLLFQGSMLFITLIVFLLLQPFMVGIPFAFADVIAVFVMGLVCFVPFALFLRGVAATMDASSNARKRNA